ncbi:MAG: RNA polymerase sigma factor, partial [Acidimicrobiales bacterium]
MYRSVAPVVLGYLRSNRVANAEDVASEVFISVMGGLDSFRGDEEAFRSWVLTIAYRRRVDDARQQIRRPEDPGLSEATLGYQPAAGDVAEAAMDRLRAGGVIDAMSRLTEDQQTVLMLRILADLPIRDICRITGKGEAAVKALLRRGLASMARTLASIA